MPDTRFDPAADDPRIAAALDARARLDRAMQAGDLDTLGALFAPDLIVHIPSGRVVDGAKVLAVYAKAGQAVYDGGMTVTFDFVGLRGGDVVMMGQENLPPDGDGRAISRRFTDIWREAGGAWTLAVRQATNLPG